MGIGERGRRNDERVKMIDVLKKNRWQKTRLKNVAKINHASLAASTFPEFVLRYLEISNVNYNGIISEHKIQRIHFSSAPSRARRIVRDGDIVISSVRPNLQAIALISSAFDNLIASTGFYVVSPNKSKLFSEYAYYFFVSEKSKQFFESVAKGVGYPAVDDKDFMNHSLCLPEIKEQKSIARYLNKNCASIDTTISIKQKQLKTLEALKKSIIHKAVTQGLDDGVGMKDSGVAWLGKIPKHWKVKILKRDFQVTLGKMLQSQPKNELETEEYYLRSANIKWDGVDISNVKKMWFSPMEKEKLKLESEDLLVSEGGDVGRSSIWNEELQDCYIQNAINRIRPRLGQSSNLFLYYWLYTLKHNGYIDAIVSRITIAHLTAEKLEKLIYLSPPLSEQVCISSHLKQKTTQIEKLKKNIVKQIETLELYRRSIIHECVTGKRRITEKDLKEP